MIYAMSLRFKKLFSIEVDQILYRAAVRRFKLMQHVQILMGDSAIKISEVIEKLDQPAIFWLDGHYSGGITSKGMKNCPIYGELECILKKSEIRHCILIDDANYFTGKDEYPILSDLKLFVDSNFSNYMFYEEVNIIHLIPRE